MRLIDADKLRESVLKWLPPDPCGQEDKEYPFETDICVSMLQEIEEAPTIEPEPQWIPCSERLPEIGKEVLLSESNTIFIAEYHGSGDPEGLWIVEGYHHYLADVNGCAWMPLPESWKGDKE